MFQLKGFEFIDSFPSVVNLRLHSWHKLIRYNKWDKIQQIWKPFVSDDLFSCFFPGADGQKRKKSLRRKLDSLAKEKSKDKGTPSSSDTHWHFAGFSLFTYLFFQSVFVTSVSAASETEPQSVDSAPQAGEQRGYNNTVSVYWALTVYI